jgi:hypothetical protein
MSDIVQYEMPHSGFELQPGRSISTVLSEAAEVAKVFQKKAEQMGLYQQIGPSKHLKIEGWQILAATYRIFAREISTTYVQFGDVRGYESVYEACHGPSGVVVSKASAMCLDDEENWDSRPKYEWHEGRKKQVGLVKVPLQQIRSMAQTRAESKVFANVFKWIAKMGGFETTPAEEMNGTERSVQQAPPPRQPQEKPAETDGLVTEKQWKRLFAIGMDVLGGDKQAYAKFLKSFGYERGNEVRTEDYERMVDALQSMKGDAAV